MTAELQVLKFKTLDLEPPKPDPILVELGGKKFEAHCPNDYEFVELMKGLRKLEDDPQSMDFKPMLESFFKPAEVREIERKMRSNDINMIGELIPAMNALAEHYGPLIQERMEEVQKRISSPK